MRLLERTLKTVYICAGLEESDALGGVKRGFSPRRVATRGSLIPSEGKLEGLEPGLAAARRCVLLLPADAKIAAGDGVCECPDGAPEWLCVDVRRWSAHVAATLERRVAA